MAKQHGKHTVIKINSVDLSAYCNTSEITDGADSHDHTGYGADGHEFTGGLRTGTITIGGVYDNTASVTPRPTIKPLIGTATTFIRQIEGAGSGKPQDSATVIVTSYVETAPVADLVQWSAELQVSGVIDYTAQSS